MQTERRKVFGPNSLAMLLFVARGAPKYGLVLSSVSSITVFSNLTVRFAGRGVFTAVHLRSNNFERIEPREGEKVMPGASEAPTKNNACSATICSPQQLQFASVLGRVSFGLGAIM